MRTKALLTALLLGSTLAGVASADPIVRDHREQPTMNYYQSRARYINKRPTWMPQYTASTGSYGYQLDADGDEVVPYNQGQDPSVENTPRASWINLWEDAHLDQYNRTIVPTYDQRLSSIELQGESGRTYVREIRVQLADGNILFFYPQRVLDRDHSPNLRVDLGPSVTCGVRRVVVLGAGRGNFRMLGA